MHLDNVVGCSATDWFNWLKQEEDKTCEAYWAKPDKLISDFRREKGAVSDYKGREILELLQNAADQAMDASIGGKVVIHLTRNGLVVANNGAAFSKRGVRSLQTADFSPKRNMRSNFIGDKGLGFRSILNWTKYPIILSKGLAVCYSRNVLEAKLAKLMNSSEEVASLVCEEKVSKKELVIPMLPFPGYDAENNLCGMLHDAVAKDIYSICNAMVSEGYTTAIGMPFTVSAAFEEAQKQIKLLRAELLLFVEHLSEIKFVVCDEEYIWRCERGPDECMILKGEEPLGIWQVFKDSGRIPKELCENNDVEALSYELAVAIPDLEEDDEVFSSNLYSYFPTKIEMPLPVVCHATLELNQSRNQFVEGAVNNFVLKQLARFLGVLAEKRAQLFPTGKKAGFRLLMNEASYSSDLIQEEFPEYLLKEASKRSIIPTLGGKAVTVSDSYHITGAGEGWLPVNSFKDIALVQHQTESEFFIKLGLESIDDEDFKERLLSLTDLSIESRVQLVAGLIDNSISSTVYDSAFLPTTSRELAQTDSKLFILPQGLEIEAAPSWASIQFLDDKFQELLMSRLDLSDVRDFQRALRDFGVQEYSFANLIRRVVADANRYQKRFSEKEQSINEELVNYLFNLFCVSRDVDGKASFQGVTRIRLLNQEGKLVPVDKLYLGEGYGATGKIVQEFYGKWAKERLVASPDHLGFSETNLEKLIDFLSWVGVERWPRKIREYVYEIEFEKYLLGEIPYPAVFDDYRFESKENIYNAWVEASTFDGLEEIFENASYVAICAWLSLDDRFSSLLKKGSGAVWLSTKRGYDRNDRYYRGALPSYLKWKLENTRWVITKDGDCVCPSECLLGMKVSENLFPQPARAEESELLKYGIDYDDLVGGLRRGGVASSLTELSTDRLYQLLLGWPERDPEGKYSRSLYRVFLDTVDFSFGGSGRFREEFFANGQLWGQVGDKKAYYPVSELLHVDSEGFPKTLLSQFKLVDLPYRVGADKVERVFGIGGVDRKSLKQRAKSYVLAKNLDKEFQDAKFYWYRARAAISSQKSHLATLKKLRLQICSELISEVFYEDKVVDSSVPMWGWFIAEGVLYVRCNPLEDIDHRSDLLADVIGAAIASIFRISDGGDFARLFSCRPEAREQLLERIRGEVPDEDVVGIMKELEIEEGVVECKVLQNITSIPALELKDENLAVSVPLETVAADVEVENDNVADRVKEKGEPEAESTPLTLTPFEVEPKREPKRRALSVRNVSGSITSRVSSSVVLNADACELKVVEIEEKYFSRFALQVGHLTGFGALGCDVLSFDSSEERDKFRSGEDRRFENISRFIEVKARKMIFSEVELRGNEKNAAVQYKEKYYLYRLSGIGADKYYLSILNNPIDCDEVVEASIYIHMDRTCQLESYEVTGGA